jgi:hypothetical protein
MRTTKIIFPDGIKCKVGKIPGLLKMKNQFRLIKVPGAGKQVDNKKGDGTNIQVLAYIVWRLIVDGEARMIEKQDSEDSDDYEQAYKRMSEHEYQPKLLKCKCLLNIFLLHSSSFTGFNS